MKPEHTTPQPLPKKHPARSSNFQSIRVFLCLLTGLICCQIPGLAKEILIDDFESGLLWVADNTNDAAVLSVVPTRATEATHSLLITFPNLGREKIIVHRAANQDLTSIVSLVLDATNPQTNAMNVAIALQTGPKWDWFESRPVTLHPGLNQNVRFDLAGKNFKSDRTETLDAAQQYTDALGSPDQLQRISLLVYSGTANPVNLFVDNLRWAQSASGAPPAGKVATELPASSHLSAVPGEMLLNGSFAAGVTNWVLEQTDGASGRIACVPEGPDGTSALRIEVLSITNKAWHLQLYQTGPRLEQGRTYELTFWAKSDRADGIKVNCMQNHEPWDHHTQQLLPLSTNWQKLHFTFVAPWSDDNVRISFTDLGAAAGQIFWLARCSLVPMKTTSPSFEWASDCSAENTYVNSHHPSIPGHYEYLPDPDGQGTVFRGRLTEDFKVEDPQKVHLHPEIYFNEFHPGNFAVSFEVRVDDLQPDVLGPYTDKPWLNVVTTFDRTKLTGDADFKPSVMVNLVGSPRAYFLQTYSISPAGEGTFFNKVPTAPGFPIRKWVSVKVEVDVAAMRVRTYQDGVLVSEGPYKARPGLAGLHMGLYTNRLMHRATVYNRDVKIAVWP